MNFQTASKQKEDGTKIIFKLTKLISDLNNFSIGIVFFGKKKKTFDIITTHYNELIREVSEYNTVMDADIAIGTSQQTDQIYPSKVLKHQLVQIQNLMNQVFALFAGKQMELRFQRTLEFSFFAIILSLASILFKVY